METYNILGTKRVRLSFYSRKIFKNFPIFKFENLQIHPKSSSKKFSPSIQRIWIKICLFRTLLLWKGSKTKWLAANQVRDMHKGHPTKAWVYTCTYTRLYIHTCVYKDNGETWHQLCLYWPWTHDASHNIAKRGRPIWSKQVGYDCDWHRPCLKLSSIPGIDSNEWE